MYCRGVVKVALGLSILSVCLSESQDFEICWTGWDEI